LEILREHFLRVALEEFRHQESGIFGEVALVENKKELGALVTGLD
jgi:hypothetical protein